MITMLLAFGTLWFWLVAAAIFCVMVALVENEKSVWAGFCLVGTFVAFYLCGNTGMLDWAKSHPMALLYYFGGYLAGATVWGFIKWYLFTTGENEKYEEAKHRFLKYKNEPQLTDDLKEEWTAHVKDGYFGNSYDAPRFLHMPAAKDHKGKVLAWMTYWPWSAFWTLLNDPLRRIMRLIYSYISGMLDGISKHAFRNSANDLVSTSKAKPKKDRYIDLG